VAGDTPSRVADNESYDVGPVRTTGRTENWASLTQGPGEPLKRIEYVVCPYGLDRDRPVSAWAEARVRSA